MTAVITAPVLCTREDVQGALDIKGTARAAAQVDGVLAAATVATESQLNRRFTPWTGTRYFDWPTRQDGAGWVLWLEDSEVISLSALTAGGVAIAPANYNLEPSRLGPPYDRIELNIGTATAFSTGNTPQRNIAATGVFGYNLDTAPAGALAEALDDTETAVDVTDASGMGVGDLLLCGTERMLVTDRTWLTTGQTVQTPLTASAANTTVAVTTGSAYAPGEVLLLDSEQMLVTDVAGNNLAVKRAWNGSVLATHSGSTIYASRTLTVVRGAAGTTAASHLTAAALTRHAVPPLVRALAIAESLTLLLGQGSGYARPAGAGAAVRPQPGSIEDVRYQAFGAYGRIRIGAV